MKKINLRRTKGLRRWNKVFSKLIQDYKKRGESYDIADVRKEASALLPEFKNIPPSKISKKKVVNAKEKKPKLQKKEDVILATEIPQEVFDRVYNWYDIGQELSNLNSKYPDIPIMLISSKLPPLVIDKATGSYDGSVFQEWVENIRDELTDPNDSATWDIGQFFGTASNIDGKIFAVFFEDGTPIPTVVPPVTDIEPRKKEIIDEIEGDFKEKQKKKRKTPLPKGKKKKELPKVKKKKEKITDKQSEELTKQLELVERLFDKGVYNKKELKEKIDEILSKYKKGGIV